MSCCFLDSGPNSKRPVFHVLMIFHRSKNIFRLVSLNRPWPFAVVVVAVAERLQFGEELFALLFRIKTLAEDEFYEREELVVR